MRFLIDAQLPPSLARWLGERGYSASAARDEGLRDADDGSICNFAMKGMWIIVTKDEDMIDRALASAASPRVVWLRIGNSTNPELFQWLESFWSRIIAQLDEGQHVVEARR